MGFAPRQRGLRAGLCKTVTFGKPFAKKKTGPGDGRKRPNKSGWSDYDGGRWSKADDWLTPASKAERLAMDTSRPVELECEHFGTCAGCSTDRALTETPIMSQARALLSLEVTRGPAAGWRTHAKLAASPVGPYGGVKLGLFERGSHTVLPIPQCAVHHPKINEAAQCIERAASKVGVTGYAERDGRGMLRYVQLSVERATGLVQCTLVWNSESFRDASPWAQRFVKALRAESQKSASKAAAAAAGRPEANAEANADAEASSGAGSKESEGKDLTRLNVAALKELLQAKGLPVSGKKAALVARLNDAAASKAAAAGQGEGGQDPLWHSIWFHWRTGEGNAIFGRGDKRWHRAFGPEFLRERLFDGTSSASSSFAEESSAEGASPTFFFSPLVFRQANLAGFARIVQELLDPKVIPPGSTICELYGGIGLVGLSLLAPPPSAAVGSSASSESGLGGGLAGELRCSDENPANVRAFEMARKSLPLEAQGLASFLCASALDALDGGDAEGADVLVVDPPRKGLEREVLAILCDPMDPRAATVHTLCYISCGFAALQAELPVLVQQGGWRLESSQGFALFPGSDHVETLCVLRRDVSLTTEDLYDL